MTASAELTSSVLRKLLLVLGDSVVELMAAPAGLDAAIHDVVILDADDEPDGYAGDLVLVIGARGKAAIRMLRLAARNGAAAVAVKVSPEDDRDALRAVAEEAGVVVLGLRPEAKWTQVESAARDVLADVGITNKDGREPQADLYALAQTVSSLAGGNVSIEDPANRVLAYSQADDDIDELRRMTILGWHTPREHLARLRRLGVFERLRSSDDVVDVDPHPELGMNRRLIAAVRVDGQMLGSIWLQEGSKPLASEAADVLRGAARTAAIHLIHQRTGMTPSLYAEQSLLSWLLDGHIDPHTFAHQVGADPDRPAVVAAFAIDSPGEFDRSAFELRKAMICNLVAVHASAFHRALFVTSAGRRVYLLVPNLTGHAVEFVRDLAADIVKSAEQRLRIAVFAAIGPMVDSLDHVKESTSQADRVLDIITRNKQRRVATIADIRSEVLVSQTLTLLENAPHLRDPRVSDLVQYDAKHDGEMVRSLIAYIAKQGNVGAAARDLHVHPNTLRYRLKRAETVSGIDLSNPYECLFTYLQLLLDETIPSPLSPSGSRHNGHGIHST